MTAVGRGWRAVVPPRATFAPTVRFVVPLFTVAAVAAGLGGGSGLLGFVLGVSAVSQSAVGAARLLDTAVVGLAAAVCAWTAVVLPDNAAVAAGAVGLAALVAAPFNQRSDGAGAVLPVVVAVLVVSEVKSAVSTAAWLLVAAAVTTVLARVLGVRRLLPPVAPSVAWRHATVMAVVAGLTAWAVVWRDVAHGYWAVATVCIVLRPAAGETTRAARDRVLGTVVGALVAVVVAALLPGWAVVMAAAICGLLMVGWLIAADQGRYVAFLTPVVVLSGATSAGSAFDLAADRVVLSAVGAVLAAGAVVGLRAYERRRPQSRPVGDDGAHD